MRQGGRHLFSWEGHHHDALLQHQPQSRIMLSRGPCCQGKGSSCQGKGSSSRGDRSPSHQGKGRCSFFNHDNQPGVEVSMIYFVLILLHIHHHDLQRLIMFSALPPFLPPPPSPLLLPLQLQNCLGCIKEKHSA